MAFLGLGISAGGLRAQTSTHGGDPCATNCLDLICPGTVVVACQPGLDPPGAMVNLPRPVVTNYCGSVPTGLTLSSVPPPTTPPGPVYFPPGTNTVVWCVSDGKGYTSCCCFEVIVRDCPTTSDRCRPEITCPGDLVIDHCPATNGVPVQFPEPRVFDPCGLVTGMNCTPASGSTFPPGRTTVACSLVWRDPATGKPRFESCCFDVVVRCCPSNCVDRLDCPGDQVIDCADPAGTPLNYVVFGTNTCEPSQVVCDPPPGSIIFGSTNVCCRLLVGGIVRTQCCFKVTVNAQAPPGIICPSNRVVNTCSNCAAVPYPAPVVVNGVLVGCNPPPTFCFPLGVTPVTCVATNPCGSAVCTFTVTVRPVPPPSIQCPTNPIVLTVPCGSNCVPISYPAPVVNHGTLIGCNPPVGTCLPAGVYPVICRASNECGVVVGCEFDLRIVPGQGEPPLIVCPDNLIVTNCSPCAVVPYPAPVVVNGVLVACNPPPTFCFPLGSTPVTCVATNPCGTAECKFTVTVRCPSNCIELVCPSDLKVRCQGPNGTAVRYEAYLTNRCTGGSVPANCYPPSGSVFPPGSATGVCCTNTVIPGAIEVCCFKVTVDDCCPKTCFDIVCPPDIATRCTETPLGLGAFVDLPKAVVTNYCDPVPSDIIVTCFPSAPTGSPVFFPPGTSTVVCCFNDPITGVENCCSFRVAVTNCPPNQCDPRIVCPTNVTACAEADGFAPVDFVPPQVINPCNVDVSRTCSVPPGTRFPIGVTTVACCIRWKDATRDRNDCCTFDVIVECCPPTNCVQVVCPSNIVVRCAGPNGADVPYTAYATNVCTGGSSPVSCYPPPGFFPPGNTQVCCTNTAAGFADYCCFTVTVLPDTIPPVITCPSNIYVLCAATNGMKVSYHPTAADDCDPAPTLTCTPPSGSPFLIGCSNVVCVATDNAGNSSRCSFKVCVLRQGCYLLNPSFELLNANLPAPNNCGDPINFAQFWTAAAGTPDLWRPPWASLAPGNCRGRENPCHGTNYAGFEGGYTASGGFQTEAMMGTLVAPLNNGRKFRLRACLSLAESSPGPVWVEFVLASSVSGAEQVIHQVRVTRREGWDYYGPPCFTVPTNGVWDRLIIRAAPVPAGGQRYPVGYVYVDNVNLCCCCLVMTNPPVVGPNGVLVSWTCRGRLQATDALGEPTLWHDAGGTVTYDPDTDTSTAIVPRSPRNQFFRVIAPDDTVECPDCLSP